MDKIFNTVKTCWFKTNRWHRMITLFLIVEFKFCPNYQLGFECNDPALSHPFTGDTISWKWLMAVTIFLPLIVLLLVEKKYHDKSSRSKKQALVWYKEYLFGFIVNLTIVETLKVLVGAPRPHFFDTCMPEESNTCQGSDFVHQYKCTKAHWLTQSDRSFPSGHTSTAVHAAIFVMYYLHCRVTLHYKESRRTVSALQALCFVVAFYCALSRILDHRHHLRDVLTGAGIAVLVLFYTILYLCNNFQPSPSLDECDKPDNVKGNEQLEVTDL